MYALLLINPCASLLGVYVTVPPFTVTAPTLMLGLLTYEPALTPKPLQVPSIPFTTNISIPVVALTNESLTTNKVVKLFNPVSIVTAFVPAPVIVPCATFFPPEESEDSYVPVTPKIVISFLYSLLINFHHL